MRSPRSTFVVEYKGSRRKQAKPLSIWGSINLDALRKEIDPDLPPVLTRSSGGVGNAERRPTVAEIVAQERRILSDVQRALNTLPPETKPHTMDSAIGGSECSEALLKREHSAEASKSNSPLLIEENGEKQSPVEDDLKTTSVLPLRSVGATHSPMKPISNEFLADLQAENSKLKEMYKARLMAENDWLTQMLTRYRD